MARLTKAHWNELKAEWINRSLAAGHPYDFEVFSKEHKVRLSTFRVRASKEKWVKEYQAAQERITARATSDLEERRVFNERVVRSRNANISANLLHKAASYLMALPDKDWTPELALGVARAFRGGELEAYGLKGSGFDFREEPPGETGGFESPIERQERYARDRELAISILGQLEESRFRSAPIEGTINLVQDNDAAPGNTGPSGGK